MTSIAPYAFEADGRVYVCADGPELYVYSGANDAPLWKQFCEGILVGVGAAGDRVLSLDSDGRLFSWRAYDGAKLSETLLDQPCSGLYVSRAGSSIALVRDGVVFVSARGDHRKMAIPDVTAVAIDREGTRAAIGTSAGTVTLHDLTDGAELARHALEGPVTALAYSPKGAVFAAGSSRVVVLDEEALAPRPKPQPDGKGKPDAKGKPPAKGKNGPPAEPVKATLAVPGTPRWIALSFDGALMACDDGDKSVHVYEMHERKHGGTIQYDRPLGGLAFGEATTLGIGLEYADANRIDVITGHLTRSLAGFGRGSEPWFPKFKVDGEMLRGAVALYRAGGKPIAEIVWYEEKSKRGCWIAAAITTVLTILCFGAGGTMAVIYYLRPW